MSSVLSRVKIPWQHLGTTKSKGGDSLTKELRMSWHNSSALTLPSQRMWLKAGSKCKTGK